MGQKTDKIFERAKVNLEEDDHENALRLLNEVLNREPSHKKALRNKALIKILEGNDKETEEFLLFAVEQQPKDDQLHQMLGTFYHNHDHPQKALDHFKEAIKINESNAVVHQALGILYAQVYGQHKKAVTHFSKAIEFDLNSDNMFFSRGCSYMLIDEMEKAEKDLRKAGEMGHTKAKEMIEKYF